MLDLNKDYSYGEIKWLYNTKQITFKEVCLLIQIANFKEEIEREAAQ